MNLSFPTVSIELKYKCPPLIQSPTELTVLIKHRSSQHHRDRDHTSAQIPIMHEYVWTVRPPDDPPEVPTRPSRRTRVVEDALLRQRAPRGGLRGGGGLRPCGTLLLPSGTRATGRWGKCIRWWAMFCTVVAVYFCAAAQTQKVRNQKLGCCALLSG